MLGRPSALRAVFVIVAFLALTQQQAQGASFFWSQTSSSNWSDGNNWSDIFSNTGTGPGQGDDAFLTLANSNLVYDLTSAGNPAGAFPSSTINSLTFQTGNTTLTLGSGTSLNVTNGVNLYPDNGSSSYPGAINNAITLQGATMTAGGTFLNQGTLTLQQDISANSSSLTAGKLVNVGVDSATGVATASVNVNGGSTLGTTGDLVNGSALNASSGYISVGGNFKNITGGAIVGGGSLTLDQSSSMLVSGNFTNPTYSSAGSLSYSGTPGSSLISTPGAGSVSVSNSSTLEVDGTFTNSGGSVVVSGGGQYIGGSLTIPAGTFQVTGGGSAQVDSLVVGLTPFGHSENGLLQVDSGSTLTASTWGNVVPDVIFSGNAIPGATLYGGNYAISGTLTYHGDGSYAASVINTIGQNTTVSLLPGGLITDNGVLSTFSPFVVDGTLRLDNGATFTPDAPQPLTVGSSGTLEIDAGTTYQSSRGMTNLVPVYGNGGLITSATLTGGTYIVGGTFQTGGPAIGFGDPRVTIGAITAGTSVTMVGSGFFTSDGTHDALATLTNLNGSLAYTQGANETLTSSGLTLGSQASLQVDPSSTLTMNNWGNLSGATSQTPGLLSGGSYNIGGTLQYSGAADGTPLQTINTIDTGTSVTLNGGSALITPGLDQNNNPIDAMATLSQLNGSLSLLNGAQETLSGNLTVGNQGSLTIDNTGSSALTITGNWGNVSGASSGQAGVLSGGTYNIGGTLQYAGDADGNTGTTINTIASGTSLTLNGSGASITMDGLAQNDALVNLSVNNGTFVLTGGAGLATSQTNFTNNGTLQIDANSSLNIGGSWTNLSANSAGLLSGGTYIVGGTLMYGSDNLGTQGQGITGIDTGTNLTLSGSGFITATGETNALSTLSSNAGTLTLNNEALLGVSGDPNNNGLFTNSGSLTVTGSVFCGGNDCGLVSTELDVAGGLTNTATGNVTVSQGGLLTLSSVQAGDFTNNNAVTIDSGSAIFVNNGNFVNNGTLTMTSDSGTYGPYGYYSAITHNNLVAPSNYLETTGGFTNNGTLALNGTDGHVSYGVNVLVADTTFTNSLGGTVTIGGGVNGGAGAAVEVGSGGPGFAENAGTLTIGGGGSANALNQQAGTFGSLVVFNGDMQNDSTGKLTLQGGTNNGFGGLISTPQGNFTNYGSVVMNGASDGSNAVGGGLQVGGTLTNVQGGTMTVGGGDSGSYGAQVLAGNVNNLGQMTLQGGTNGSFDNFFGPGNLSNVYGGGELTALQTFNNYGLLTLNGGDFNSGASGAELYSGTFNNYGTVIINGTGGPGDSPSAYQSAQDFAQAYLSVDGVDFNGSGNYTQYSGGTLVNGVLGANLVEIAGGILGGDGLIDANVQIDSNGTISPGAMIAGDPADMTIFGGLTMDGTFLENIADEPNTGNFDNIDVNGSVNIDGLLNVNLLGTFVPTGGEQYLILEWSGATGDENLTIVDPNFGDGLTWSLDWVSTNGGGELFLVASQENNSTPEPGTMLLLGTGIASLLAARRKRK